MGFRRQDRLRPMPRRGFHNLRGGLYSLPSLSKLSARMATKTPGPKWASSIKRRLPNSSCRMAPASPAKAPWRIRTCRPAAKPGDASLRLSEHKTSCSKGLCMGMSRMRDWIVLNLLWRYEASANTRGNLHVIPLKNCSHAWRSHGHNRSETPRLNPYHLEIGPAPAAVVRFPARAARAP